MTRIRAFNDNGVRRFETCLAALRKGEIGSLPGSLLTCEDSTLEVTPPAEIEERSFRSKLELAQYLTERVAPAARPGSFGDAGLWTWLAAFYFDAVCPLGRDGLRKPGADHRYILAGGKDWKHGHRHLLLGPVRVFAYHGTGAGVLLSGLPHTLNDFVEQLASRQEFAVNRGVVEAANLLYLDGVTGRPKKGAASNKRKPGTLRRFVDLIQQLDLTWDLQSMSGEEILSLLPDEFAPWHLAEVAGRARQPEAESSLPHDIRM